MITTDNAADLNVSRAALRADGAGVGAGTDGDHLCISGDAACINSVIGSYRNVQGAGVCATADGAVSPPSGDAACIAGLLVGASPADIYIGRHVEVVDSTACYTAKETGIFLDAGLAGVTNRTIQRAADGMSVAVEVSKDVDRLP